MTKPKRKKVVHFLDLVTGEKWWHHQCDWILLYCNFHTKIHPTLLRVGQSLETVDETGHAVRITMKWEAANNDL